ncbi:MAG: hypothetical protein GX591_10920 [Planctomycetes bacterium]|nr:hypothetical protein [Planctomycetota bacterium]
MSQAAPPPLPASGRAPAAAGAPYELPAELPCVSCGYTLRGLMTDGRCPECGTDLAASLDPRLLRFAPPAYVRTLAMGLLVIFGGGSLCFIATLVLTILVQTLAEGPREQGLGIATMVSGLVATCLMGILGTWLLTTPDPESWDEPLLSARRTTRVVVPLLLGYLLLALLTVAADRAPYADDDLLPAEVVALAAVVGLLAALAYLRGLVGRVPDGRLKRDLGITFCGVALAPVMVMILAAVDDSHPRTPRDANLLSIIRIVATLWPVVFGLSSLSVMLRSRLRFRDSAKLARANWDAGVRVVGGRVVVEAAHQGGHDEHD